MKFPAPWKPSKSAAVAIGMSALAGLPVHASAAEASGNTNRPDNFITGGCVWTGPVEKITYMTANGDLYQVTMSGRQFAEVKASIQDGGKVVTAHWDALPYTMYNSPDGSVRGLRIDPGYLNFDHSTGLPSDDDLKNDTKYAFRMAAEMAQEAFYFDRSRMPRVICADSLSLDNFSGYQHRAPHIKPPSPR